MTLLFVLVDVYGSCTDRSRCRNEYNSSTRQFYRIHWGLTEVPQDIPADAFKVHLRFNKISVLPTGVFRNLSQCVQLDLNGNQIFFVHKDAFEGLDSLQYLDLDSNKISSFESETFANLGSLVGLYLVENHFSVLQSSMFAGLVNLQEIYISKNQISVLEEGVLDSLYSMKKIELTMTDLTTLNANVFINLPRLPLTLILSAESETTSKWKCSSLCWLKHEEQHGTVVWYMYPPKCSGEVEWTSLQCDDKGKICANWAVMPLICHNMTKSMNASMLLLSFRSMSRTWRSSILKEIKIQWAL